MSGNTEHEPVDVQDDIQDDGETPVTDKEETEQDDASERDEYVEEIDLEELKSLREKAARLDSLLQEYEKSDTDLKTLRKELKETRKQVQEFEREKMTEREKLELQAREAAEERDRLLQELRAVKVQGVIGREAEKRNVPINLAVKLIGDIEFDEDGEPVGVDQALDSLVREYPQIVRQQQAASPTHVQKATGRTAPRKLTMEDLQRMTPDEVNQRWDEVQQVLTQSA